MKKEKKHRMTARKSYYVLSRSYDLIFFAVIIKRKDMEETQETQRKGNNLCAYRQLFFFDWQEIALNLANLLGDKLCYATTVKFLTNI